ncbi:unnamed protein product, partial [marine sediment metagenome]
MGKNPGTEMTIFSQPVCFSLFYPERPELMILFQN